MKSYICKKVVSAEKMSYKEAGKKELIRKFDPNGKDIPGFHIVYKDGYESWSPADTFIEGYDEIKTENLTFGQAIEALKAGKKVAREGWNGKGMFLFLVPGSKFKVNRPPLLGIYPEGTEIEYRPHIDLKTADGSIATWSPSGSDALAEDWIIIDD